MAHYEIRHPAGGRQLCSTLADLESAFAFLTSLIRLEDRAEISVVHVADNGSQRELDTGEIEAVMRDADRRMEA